MDARLEPQKDTVLSIIPIQLPRTNKDIRKTMKNTKIGSWDTLNKSRNRTLQS